MSTFLSRFSLAMALSFLSSSPEESKDSSSYLELPVNRERLLDMLVDLDSSLVLVLGDLEQSLLDELVEIKKVFQNMSTRIVSHSLGS